MNYSIDHLGAENCVTGSCHLLRTEGLNILVDCGMVQGNDKRVQMEDWPVKPSEVDYLFLTHAHIDHIGRLPELIEKGFNGEIICTHPTQMLLIPMLSDAMAFSDRSRHAADSLCQTITDLSWGFEYDRKFDLKRGISFKLGNAGHILGSCFIRFESGSGSGSGDGTGWSILFSGDIGPKETPILPDPAIPEPCDLLILESTYGDRLHEGRHDRIRRLGEILTKALSDNGKVFIPCFALGRTQELLYEMDRLFSDRQLKRQFPLLKRIPVFIDSPLGLQLTEIYSKLSGFWDKEAKQIKEGGDHPLDFKHLYAVKNHTDHLELLDMPGPAIIIAGSGMCTGGRILDHLEQGLSNPGNDILFVGYQGIGTTGWEITRNSNKPGGYVQINGNRIPIHAKVHTLTGYSAHADVNGLVEWVESISHGSGGKKPDKIKLVHGDPHAQQELALALRNKGQSV